MDKVICKVVDNTVYKAMRYEDDTLFSGFPLLIDAMLLDTAKNSGWQKVDLKTYRNNVESGKWEELDEEDAVLDSERDIWEVYDDDEA